MINKFTVGGIIGNLAREERALRELIASLGVVKPVYYPLVTGTNDYEFERMLGRAAHNADMEWNYAELVKASPLDGLANAVNNYFSLNHAGGLDNYLFTNGMTVPEAFANLLYAASGHRMAGLLVECESKFIFAEFGYDDDDEFFNSLGSFEDNTNPNAPYGIFECYSSYAPVDVVDIAIISGTINFDIKLLCKDVNGDSFVVERNVSGSDGDVVMVELGRKTVGFSGLADPYSGFSGDFLRIQSIGAEG